jgi:hypothetical protein
MDFTNIAYLKNGNSRQKAAYTVLTDGKIMDKLEEFDPILVGTIPIEIDIENSDLDIICCVKNKEIFIERAVHYFENEIGFKITEHDDPYSITVQFTIDDFDIELFGQSIPTKRQLAYRHMIVEHELLLKKGKAFKQRIIELKRQGFKTEPAFAKELGLEGEPYAALLKFEKDE